MSDTVSDTLVDDLTAYDISALKLGKGDAVRPVGLHDLSAYSTGFPTPPATFPPAPDSLAALQAISWGMDGNDTLGDCTIAGADHVIAAANALLNTNDPRPSLPVLEAQYKVLSPNDQGCVIANVLQAWRSQGLFQMPGGSNKIGQYAPFDQRKATEFHQVIAFTGAAYLGIACPQSAQQQFAKQVQTGELVPWTVVKGSPIAGGHCIVAVGYIEEGLLCVSWGGVVLVTWPFLRKYCDEGWALLTQELGEKGADTLGLDVAQLNADLDALPRAA
jgi:hypothetical protein